jgi:hypothetical protein
MQFIEEILNKREFLESCKLDNKSLDECLFELGKNNISQHELIHWEIAYDNVLDNWVNVEEVLFGAISNQHNQSNEMDLASSLSSAPSSSSSLNEETKQEGIILV